MSRQHSLAAKFFGHPYDARGELMVDIVKVDYVGPLGPDQGGQPFTGFLVVNEASGNLQSIQQPVAIVIVDLGREIVALARGQVVRVLHGKLDHLVTRLTHHLPLLKENRLGTALHEKNLLANKTFTVITPE